MVILRVTTAQADLVEESAQRDFGAGVIAGLLDVDRRRFGLDRRVERIADRHLIFGQVPGDRDPGVEVAVDIAEPKRALLRGSGRIGKLALEVREFLDFREGTRRGLLAKVFRQYVPAGFE